MLMFSLLNIMLSYFMKPLRNDRAYMRFFIERSLLWGITSELINAVIAIADANLFHTVMSFAILPILIYLYKWLVGLRKRTALLPKKELSYLVVHTIIREEAGCATTVIFFQLELLSCHAEYEWKTDKGIDYCTNAEKATIFLLDFRLAEYQTLVEITDLTLVF